MIPVGEYKKILEKIPVCCIDVIIRRGNNDILLVKRRDEPAKGQWWFPGGRLLKKERLENAAVRKAKDETGLDIEIEKMVGCYETIFDTGPLGIATGTHSVNTVFLASLIDEDYQDIVEIDSTSLAYKWFNSYDDLHPYIKKAIDDSECWAETSSDYYFCALFDIASGISGSHDDLKLHWPGPDGEWLTPHEFGLKIRRMIAREMDADSNQKEEIKDGEAE